MSTRPPGQPDRPEGQTYEIRLRGHLDARWAARLGVPGLTHEGDGTTTLALRVQFDIGERTYGLPVPFGRSRLAAGSEGDDHRVDVRADGASMTLVEVRSLRRSRLTGLRARLGRKR